jgi:hypothetical protein
VYEGVIADRVNNTTYANKLQLVAWVLLDTRCCGVSGISCGIVWWCDTNLLDVVHYHGCLLGAVQGLYPRCACHLALATNTNTPLRKSHTRTHRTTGSASRPLSMQLDKLTYVTHSHCFRR